AELIGPESPMHVDRTVLKVPFAVTIQAQDRAVLKIGGSKHEVIKDGDTEGGGGGFSLPAGGKGHGAGKFLLLPAPAGPGLYVTPINIDPESPVMPISAPAVYCNYLTKRQGAFATLGLAEDTWAVNEHVLGDLHFKQQCLDADREREEMFFDALEKVPRGL